MADDLIFYDLSLNRLGILPSYACGEGYTSMNAKAELNGNGSFEAVIKSHRLDEILHTHKDGLLVSWREFWGYMTAFRTTKDETRLFGTSLNGILHRIAVEPCTEGQNTIEYFAQKALYNRVPWLTFDTSVELTDPKTYGTDGYTTADEYLQKLFDGTGCGYEVRAEGKQFTYRHIKPMANPLVLSERLLNASDITTTYNNAPVATTGWYYDEKYAKWKSIETQSHTGIHKIETVLKATSSADARTELDTKTAQMQMTAKAEGLHYQRDYRLGDVVQIDDGVSTAKKQITAVEMWQESEYAEQPILTDWSEDNE